MPILNIAGMYSKNPFDVFNKLLNAKSVRFNVNQVDDYGRTSGYYVLKRNQIQVLQLLIRHGLYMDLPDENNKVLLDYAL